ncbi:substrate-binding domain-containing protein [Klenkia brasiliensis]|uniref:Monosaccharide ABC transporter substrate-binding protein, CUT2 family (TC 3.A.1.2.-) n=1 Tax=Klenkia brasiliensis TaxID=333142 RepID=A0A1G7PUZ5_9ACTN|nr:substrate-binding domain-containing protein [Klenkia brasiliensis]SDF90071.1 monosaccharide ABC transporter substrate-binding protein, CUT2 family (TC 3.A.1.2.-) [Klenkia brasiliensis]
MQLTRSRRLRPLAAALVGTTLALSACSSGDDTPSSSGDAAPASEPSLEFQGPNGEQPGDLDELTLTDEEEATVRDGSYTAAFVWHTSSEFVSAVEDGARQEFEDLGIDVVASTQADFDAATQANNVQSVLALDPDIIVTIAVDPTSAAAAFQPAVDAGKTLVVMTTPPAGYTAGDQFVSIVTESLTEAGRANAEILGDALGGSGQVGYIYHDADFWFTNQRDEAFRNWLGYEYPDMQIVAEEGFADEARTEEVAAAMIARNPDITGIYVSWATAAQGVVSALRNAGRSDVKVVTNDLDATLAADMVDGGNVVGLVGNGSIDIGRGLALAAAYGVLDKQAPALVASPPVKVTTDNLEDAWREDYGTDLPSSVN